MSPKTTAHRQSAHVGGRERPVPRPLGAATDVLFGKRLGSIQRTAKKSREYRISSGSDTRGSGGKVGEKSL